MTTDNRSLIGRATRPVILPASFAQEAIWQYCQTPAGMAAYMKSEVNEITGPLDVDVMGRTINYIVGRHEIMRSRVASLNGKVVQVIQPHEDFELALHVVPEGADAEALAIQISQDMISGCSFDELPLVQFALLRVDSSKHWLLYSCHQLVWDQWTSKNFLDELTQIYEDFLRGDPPRISSYEEIQYGDFSDWQRRRMEIGSEGYEETMRWWGNHFSQLADQDVLPFSRETVLTDVDPREGHIDWRVEVETRDAVKRLRRSAATSLYVTWLAAITAVLSDSARNTGLTIGTYMSCRSLDVAANNMMGIFINLVAVQPQCDRSLTFAQWARGLHRLVTEVQHHSEIPHDRLCQALAERGTAAPEVKLILGAPMNIGGDLHFGGLTLSRKVMGQHPAAGMPWGMSISIWTDDDDSVCWFNANAYDPERVRHFLERVKLLLRQAAATPDEPLRVLLSDQYVEESPAPAAGEEEGLQPPPTPAQPAPMGA